MRNWCGRESKRSGSLARRILGTAFLHIACISPLAAQGVTGAAIQGTLTGRAGEAVTDADITVLNLSNGARWQTSSHGGGRYYLENLTVGGPYSVEVRAIGHRPTRQSGIILSLGQRYTLDIHLDAAAVELESVTVLARSDPRLNAGRTGPAQFVSESTIVRLPVAGREFSLLARLAPQVIQSSTGGLSIAGQPDRLNALQIDGASNNDLLGGSSLGGVGTPGQDLGVRSLPVEAVKELQILSAPFDVRFGNFAGGLVNAVTRSGSNSWETSFTGYYSGGSLIGSEAGEGRGGEFETRELGVTLAGPIVRDRVAFFLAAGLQHYTRPDNTLVIGSDTTGGADSVGVGIRLSSLIRFQDILRNDYGVAPGSADPFPLEVPAGNAFGKVTLQLGVNSRLEISHDYAHSSPRAMAFGCREFATPFCLDSRTFNIPFTLHATHLEWASASAGGTTNQLVLGRLWSRLLCHPGGNFAGVEVGADNGTLSAGQTGACAGDRTIQHLLELTNNLGFTLGSHRITLGTHDEWIRVPNFNGLEFFFFTNWTFVNLDSLEQGRPSSYAAILRSPERPTGPLSDLDVKQLGVYLQDHWSATPRMTIMAGIRLDVPFLSNQPRPNPALLADLAVDNSQTPSGQPLWSPRLGFNYDVRGNGHTFVRAGVGLFAGRPAYKWFEDVYTHTGLEAVELFCTGSGVPAFILDVAHQPAACAGSGVSTPAALVNVFHPGFRFPRNLKVALGADHLLPGGVVGTADLLYTRAVDQYDLTDLNLQQPVAAAGEGNRLMYGVIDTFGFATPSRRAPAFGPVVQIRNRSGNHAVSFTAQLQRDFHKGFAINASYTITRSKDWFSAISDNTNEDLAESPLDGSLNHRRQATSLWEVPHRVTLMVTANLPLAFRAALFYEGVSGNAFTYQVDGDANGDGFPNDIVYVPQDVRPGGDISLAIPDEMTQTMVPAPSSEYQRLDRVIRGERCLDQSRGQVMRRNRCRNPWINRTDARIARAFTVGGRGLELTLDVFNLLHLLHHDWGLVRGTDNRLLRLVGYDNVNGRGLYQLRDTHQFIDEGLTRWRVQLGARYAF